MAAPDSFAPQNKDQQFAISAASGTAQDGSAQARAVTFTEVGSKRLLDVTSNEVEATGFNGGTVSVGTAPVQLTFTGQTQSIMITADFANGTIIYIGASDVAQDGANAMTFIHASQDVTIELNDDSAALYVVGGTTGQKVYKVALT